MKPGFFDQEVLLREHRLYDQYVDVVSSFEWIFTEVSDLRTTVTHFERFPSVTAADGKDATPDFSVVFSDGSGLVGEIARVGLAEQSVDALCRQIGRYDTLVQLPGPDGSLVRVKHVDVLLLVPFDIGTDVVRRVLHERMLSDQHDYSPSHAPCIVQFVAQSDKYVFQRRRDPGNGSLREDGREGIGGWFARTDFKPRAEGFAGIKAQRPFINDPVAPLYLACQLWTKVFPLMVADVAPVGDYQPWIGTLDEVAAEVRARFGSVAKSAVERAMEVLAAGRCAEKLADGRWRIAWGNLASRSGEDLASLLARRAVKPPSKGPIRRLAAWYEDNRMEDPAKTVPPAPGTLF